MLEHRDWRTDAQTSRLGGGMERLKTWLVGYGDVIGVIFLLLLLYVVTFLYTPVRNYPELYLYVLQPALWGLTAGVAFWGWRRHGVPVEDQRMYLLWALGGGVLLLLVWLLVGVLTRFGHSPYAHALPLLLGNLLYVIARALGKEGARALLLHRAARRTAEGAFVGVVLLFTLLSLSPGVWHVGPNRTGWVIMFVETVLPTLALEMLYTYTAWVGGPWAAVALHGLRDVFEWVSPYLPNPNWMIRGLSGTLVPILVLVVMALVYERYLAVPASEEGEASQEEAVPQAQPGDTAAWGWMLASIALLFLTWMTAGLLQIRLLVIQGISMEPTYHHGDLVFVRAVPMDEVQVGDVVVFRRGRARIAHRVIAIKEQNGERVLITQGDNNNVPDSPVTSRDFEGVVVLWVPKLGWLSLGLKAVLGTVH